MKPEPGLTERPIDVTGVGVKKRVYCEDSAVGVAENNQSQTEHMDTPDMYQVDFSLKLVKVVVLAFSSKIYSK